MSSTPCDFCTAGNLVCTPQVGGRGTACQVCHNRKTRCSWARQARAPSSENAVASSLSETVGAELARLEARVTRLEQENTFLLDTVHLQSEYIAARLPTAAPNSTINMKANFLSASLEIDEHYENHIGTMHSLDFEESMTDSDEELTEDENLWGVGGGPGADEQDDRWAPETIIGDRIPPTLAGQRLKLAEENELSSDEENPRTSKGKGKGKAKAVSVGSDSEDSESDGGSVEGFYDMDSDEEFSVSAIMGETGKTKLEAWKQYKVEYPEDEEDEE